MFAWLGALEGRTLMISFKFFCPHLRIKCNPYERRLSTQDLNHVLSRCSFSNEYAYIYKRNKFQWANEITNAGRKNYQHFTVVKRLRTPSYIILFQERVYIILRSLFAIFWSISLEIDLFKTLGSFGAYLGIHQLNCLSYFILFNFYIVICYSFVTISWDAFFNSSPLFLLEIRAFWMKEHKCANKKNNPTQTEHKQKPMLRILGLDIFSMA